MLVCVIIKVKLFSFGMFIKRESRFKPKILFLFVTYFIFWGMHFFYEQTLPLTLKKNAILCPIFNLSLILS